LLRVTNRLAEAEPLYRRALAIAEASYGTDHPEVASKLNNLARLLQDTNRLAEAEPLMRRMVEIFLNFTRATGHSHPHLEAAADNYGGLLEEMGRSGEEIEATLAELGGRYGQDLTGVGGRGEKQPSAKLRPVLEEIMRDQSKIQEIAARLQQEDPPLFMELVEFIQSQQGDGEAQTEPTPEQRLTAQRQTAGQLIKEGRYSEASEILEQLLTAGFEIPGTHSHLARVCLLTDRISEARDHAEKGWQHRAVAPPYVVPRLLWLQLAGGMMEDSGGSAEQSATVKERLITTLFKSSFGA
jgi:tetratricopeptide (TPR) repeat protein